MEWTDEGFVLSARKHGEQAALLHVMTRDHGRHAGLVLGGLGARYRPALQVGNLLRLQWRARLAEQLGHFQLEIVTPHAALIMDDPLRLLGLSAMAAMLERLLPEREAHPKLFDATAILIDALSDPDAAWAQAYVRWEMGLLAELGFGLDVSACALTGETEGLAFVSPKSGKAATLEAGRIYKEKLLPLPSFLCGGRGQEQDPQAALRDGLALTGFFLERHVLSPHGWTMPDARDRLAAKLARPNRGDYDKTNP